MSVTSWGQGAAGSDAIMSIIETPDIYIPHIYVIQPDFWQPLLTKMESITLKNMSFKSVTQHTVIPSYGKLR